jgi:hypothetical protein
MDRGGRDRPRESRVVPLSYDALKAIRTAPTGKAAIIPIGAAAAAPMPAVPAIQVPVTALLLKLLNALV